MTLEERKINSFQKNIKDLPDRPSDEGISAEELKAFFDGRTDEEIKESINGIIDDLQSGDAAAELGANIEGENAESIAGVLASYKKQLQERYTKTESDALAASKQDKLVGLAGQIVGFNAQGEAVAQAAPSGGGGNIPFVEIASGDGISYTASVSGVGELYDGLTLYVTPNRISASVTPTLNINGLGAKEIRIGTSYSTGIADSLPRSNYLAATRTFYLTFNGNYWMIGKTLPDMRAVTNTLPIANGGTGATTAESAIEALGAATLASPAFTGTPTAPTAAVGTNTTQIATTAFVQAAVGQAPSYTYGTEDLTAGVSPLETGKLHFVYE